MTDRSRSLIGAGLVMIAALSWSTAGLFTRVVTTDIPTTLFWRSLTGGFCVALIYAWLKGVGDLRRLFSFGLGELVIAVLSALGMMCFISAFFYTTIANVSFLYGTMPLVTLLFAAVFLRERPTLIALFCCLSCAVGVAIMMWGEQDFQHWTGVVLAFGMTIFMAAITVAAKHYPRADLTKATYLSAFLATLAVLPFTSFNNTLPSDYLWLFLYGFVNVGLGFGVYLLGVARVPAIAAALIGLSEIPIAPVWAWVLFGENPETRTIVGGSIILASTAIYLVMKSARPALSALATEKRSV